jgi:hypothetical protein
MFDLVKYLVSVRSTLGIPEMGRLTETPAFPKEGAEKNNRLLGQVQRFNDTEPRIFMNQSTSFVSLAFPLLTGAPIIYGDRNPMKTSSCDGLRSNTRVTN